MNEFSYFFAFCCFLDIQFWYQKHSKFCLYLLPRCHRIKQGALKIEISWPYLQNGNFTSYSKTFWAFSISPVNYKIKINEGTRFSSSSDGKYPALIDYCQEANVTHENMFHAWTLLITSSWMNGAELLNNWKHGNTLFAMTSPKWQGLFWLYRLKSEWFWNVTSRQTCLHLMLH